MEARRFCFLYNFCHHAGQRARRIPVYLHRRRRRSCVFIHYSDSNIREKTLLEVLQSPLFMAYHDGQPFNENHLRPCPMLENPELLREMIAKVGGFPFYKHSKTLHRIKGSFTNLQWIYLVEKRTLQNAKSFQSVEKVCNKCRLFRQTEICIVSNSFCEGILKIIFEQKFPATKTYLSSRARRYPYLISAEDDEL